MNVTEKQIIEPFSDTAATISNDSAFTVSFEVQNFDMTVYDTDKVTQKVIFEKPLPEGTKLILQDLGNNRYYHLPHASGSYITLGSFIRMGTDDEKFKPEPDSGTLRLNFIVDFSAVAEGQRISSEQDLSPKLVLTADNTVQENAVDVKNADVPVIVKTAGSFVLEERFGTTEISMT